MNVFKEEECQLNKNQAEDENGNNVCSGHASVETAPSDPPANEFPVDGDTASALSFTQSARINPSPVMDLTF